MSESVELEEAWKDVEVVYGKKAANELKKLTPADPLLLHDLMVISHLGEGKSRKEVQTLLDSYTEKDWENDMKHFAKTIRTAQETAREYIRSIKVRQK